MKGTNGTFKSHFSFSSHRGTGICVKEHVHLSVFKLRASNPSQSPPYKRSAPVHHKRTSVSISISNSDIFAFIPFRRGTEEHRGSQMVQDPRIAAEEKLEVHFTYQ